MGFQSAEHGVVHVVLPTRLLQGFLCSAGKGFTTLSSKTSPPAGCRQTVSARFERPRISSGSLQAPEPVCQMSLVCQIDSSRSQE